MTTLGEKAQVYVLSVTGNVDVSDEKITELIAAAVGMTLAAEPHSWDYKVLGWGDIGSITVQPIIESFIAIDAWPHGRYLFVCSCREFDSSVVDDVCRGLGFQVHDHLGGVLHNAIQR